MEIKEKLEEHVKDFEDHRDMTNSRLDTLEEVLRKQMDREEWSIISIVVTKKKSGFELHSSIFPAITKTMQDSPA